MYHVTLSNFMSILRHKNPHINPIPIRTRFTWPNPEFHKNQRLGFSNFGTPISICLARVIDANITLPRGLIAELHATWPDMQIVDHTVTCPTHFKPSRILLKPYQKPAVQSLLQKNQGILIAPPGSGKTIMMIEIIVRRRQKSLVLVHTKDLAAQWCDRIEKWTGVKPGIINADRFEVRKITVGMVQSLNRPLGFDFVKQFGLVALDECHHCPATTFQTLVNQFPARFRYGLTATPERADGLSFLLHAVIGPTLHVVDKDTLLENGHIMKPSVRAIHTNLYLPDCRDYGQLLHDITKDQNRCDLVVSHINREAREHYCLVISERINHLNTLCERFSAKYPNIPTAIITGQDQKKKRTQAIERVNRGEIRVLFTSKISEEGLDIRRLDRLFLTTPVRSANKVRQQVGRIMRTFPGKKDAVVFDFVDDLVGLAWSQWLTRKQHVYCDYEVHEIPFPGPKEGPPGGGFSDLPSTVMARNHQHLI